MAETHLDVDARSLMCGHTAYPLNVNQYIPRFRFPFSIYSGPIIKRIIFNHPATIVFWEDGSKTVVKASNGEQFDEEKGVLLAYMKKVHGSGYYRKLVRKIKGASDEC